MARPARRPRPVCMATPRRSARLAAQRTPPPPETPPAVAPTRRERYWPRAFRHSESQALVTDNVALHQVVLVDAAPGSGKSSQIPRLLHAAGHGRVVCSQTYRLATVLAATRAAADMRVELGHEVGYSVPLDDRSSDANTVVKYTTHGALLRELAADPLLTRYGAVMVDDAHDGMALTGAVLSCVKAAAARRPDLRVVVCLDNYSTFCKDAIDGFFSRSGMDVKELWFRTYTGLIYFQYLPEPVTDYLGAAVDAVCRIHSTEPPGDVLVFLPGCTDVEAAEHALNGQEAKGFPYAWDPANKMADINALAGVILTLKALGIVGAGGDDVVASFDFFEPPHPESIHWAVRTLKAAGALSQDGKVTETGRRIAREISGRYY
uniref:Helicase associated domain-containing protein n=1 Tax=Oryza barthii TaxID=65489 RepID=A0A0D3HJ70_9ORYZ